MQVNCYICGREFKAKPAYKQKTPDLCCSLKCGYEKRKRRHPVEERFWTKVDKRGQTECWLWKASTHGCKPPYGHFQYGREHVAHRVSWILANGQIPSGMNVCHNCPTGDNPLCVNPAHLWLGTQADNMHDMAAKGRQSTGNQVAYERRPRGENHPAAKLTEAIVIDIRTRHKSKQATYADLANEYGVAVGHVRQIIYRNIWKHVA